MQDIKLLRIKGVQISLHISWFWIFALALISFYLSTSNLMLNWRIRFVIALSATLLFFISVVLHELAHTFVANRYGQNINRITLFIFGGVSNLVREPDTPKIEFLMAIAGPLLSVILGVLYFYLNLLARPDPAIHWLFFNLSYLNFLLAVFNIMPAYPLDGGRVFRAILWYQTKNLQKATQIAALVGKIFSAFIMILGAVQVLFFSLYSGIWLIFIGWFIYRMAAISPLQSEIIRLIQNIQIADAMKDYPVYVIGVDDFPGAVKEMYRGMYDYLLVSDTKKIIGILPLPDLKERTFVEKRMIILSRIPSIDRSMSLADAFNRIVETGSPVLVVMRKNDFSGIITSKEIIEKIESNRF